MDSMKNPSYDRVLTSALQVELESFSSLNIDWLSTKELFPQNH